MVVPPRPAGGPCRSRGNRRNGACARAVWGAAQPRPGGRNCRPRGETDGSGARAVIQGARRTRGKLREGIRPNPPRREKFSSPFHTARNNFLGKYKMDETFWAFRVSIYRGACDRDAWPSRRVRRAAPAAAGGSRRNGPARCLGGAHARTGGRNCRTCGETNSPLPARKAERNDTSKMGRYIFRNFLHFFLKHAILTTPLERLRGAARRTGEIRSGSGRAGTGRRTDKTVHFPLRSAATFHPRADGGPKNRRPRTVFPFSICRAPGPGRPEQSPHRRAHPQRKGVMPMIARK